MNSIAAKTNLKAIYDALEKLPDTINSSYEEAMERIGDQSEVDRDLAYQTLSWLAHAVQPLSITDLQYALAVGRDLEMTVMDSTALDNAEDVLSACGGLVVLNRSTEIVSLVRELFICLYSNFCTYMNRLHYPGLHCECSRASYL